MSYVNVETLADGKIEVETLEEKLERETGHNQYNISDYTLSPEEARVRSMIVKHFALGNITMYKPRVEFNDLCVINRDQVDQMAWNTYQPNNGDPAQGDEISSWRSRAMRPIVRNKCVSIAAHATARLIFPKVFAFDSNNDEQEDAAKVMGDLMEWAADKSNYSKYSLYRTITALFSPASIGYTEYCEHYRKVKREQNDDGSWQEELMLDEDMSGFQNVTVPVDELYIENFYEPEIQKQGWLLWRRVISHSLAEAKYAQLYPNFKHVRKGIQIVYNDANQSFYQVYDANLRQEFDEEIIYWNKSLDLKIIMVNGVMLTSYDNPNPRNDKLYPFDKFGYEIINNRCFYYKSLAFKLMQDANIINTLYPMIMDGTYLNLMPPMINTSETVIGNDVIIPGMVTTLSDSDPNRNIHPIQLATNLKAGQDALFKVEESIQQSSESPLQSGQQLPGSNTAYEISRIEQNAATVLGLFIKMISDHVKQFGRLRLGDILQYMTIPEVDKISEKELVYKTFLLHDKQSEGGSVKTRKIKFDSTLPDEMSEEEKLNASYETLDMQGGLDSKTNLFRVNPELFRNLAYLLTVDADVLNPRSEDLERAYDLETYDRMIMNPKADQEEAFRLLLSTNPKTKKDPDKFLMKEQPQQPQNPLDMAMQGQQQSPLMQAMKQKQLPQQMGVGKIA